ncbi:MAG: uroporphyrinogen decarboxylase family protein [Planctomycetota bacterium]
MKTALAHKEPDRIPFDIGGTMVTGINVNALRNLRKYLGLPEEVQVRDRVTQMADTGDEIIERLKIDVKNVSPERPSNPGLARDLGLQGDHYVLYDEFGMGWRMPARGGHYYDLFDSPLKDAQTVKEVEDYPWPDPLDEARYVNLKAGADHTVYDEKKAYVLGRVCSGMWETAMWMTGYEKFYADMILNQKLVHAIMSKLLEIKMKYWEKALETVGENVLVASTADDLGGQKGLLVSLELYRELIWPYHKRLFEFIKKKAKSKVYIFFHNDGAIWETLDLLIEAGVDIINPWQVNCSGMGDTAKFKKEYGKDLTVWGGSCEIWRPGEDSFLHRYM